MGECWYDQPNLCVGASVCLHSMAFHDMNIKSPREYSCHDEMCFYGDLGSGREI